MIIIPIKWLLNGYFIGNIPYFQTNPWLSVQVGTSKGIDLRIEHTCGWAARSNGVVQQWEIYKKMQSLIRRMRINHWVLGTIFGTNPNTSRIASPSRAIRFRWLTQSATNMDLPTKKWNGCWCFPSFGSPTLTGPRTSVAKPRRTSSPMYRCPVWCSWIRLNTYSLNIIKHH